MSGYVSGGFLVRGPRNLTYAMGSWKGPDTSSPTPVWEYHWKR